MNKDEIRDFIAIDFETATSKRYACQIGITLVKDREIVSHIMHLIKPPLNRYEQNCIAVHHIEPKFTRFAPSFPEVWELIRPLFETYPVVAHNAAFDLGVLNFNLEHYNLPLPKLVDTYCTYKLFGRSLYELCEGFGIECENHHSAEFDADCCAQFFLHWLAGEEPDYDACEWAKEHNPEKERKKNWFDASRYKERKIEHDLLIPDLTNADPDNMFYNKKVVITGIFPVKRNDLAAKLKKMGADIDTSITKRTDYVLVGEDAGWKKLEKIHQLQCEGCKLRQLSWDDFGNLII